MVVKVSDAAAYLSETSFNKDTTYQGRDVRIRKISKENKDESENNKTEAWAVLGGSSSEY